MVKRLKGNEIRVRLRAIEGWKTRKAPFTASLSLCKEFKFRDFVEAMRFMKRVGRAAEKYGHHPDIHLVRYSTVTIVVYTHLVNGLTSWDFELAGLIDRIKIQRSRKK